MKTESCWLITKWHYLHREAGGEPDPVAQAILSEVAAAEASDVAALQLGRGHTH